MVGLSKIQQCLIGGFLVLSLGSGFACGGSTTNNGGGGGGQVSTDAVTNEALIANFVINFANLTGIWTNNFFGSSGDFTVQSAYDANTGIYTITIDVNGGVFGGTDPAPETFEIDVNAFIANGTMPVNIMSASYGDITGTITFFADGSGVFEGTAVNIPAGATNAQANGSFNFADSAISFQVDGMSFDFGGNDITVTNTFN